MKFFFGILAFIAAAIVVVLLLVGLFRSFGDGEGNTPISSSYDLEEPRAIDTVVRYRVVGPVVADEDFRQLRITISKNARTIDVLKGYQGTVEKSQTYPNTPEAYQAFIGALRAAQFTNAKSGVTTDPSSTCVTGNKYYFELSESNQKPLESWTTSCSLAQGTFGGNFSGTQQIFKSQIPEYSTFISNTNLYGL